MCWEEVRLIKRIAALVLSLLLIVAVLPLGVSAADDDAQQIRQKIRRHYYWTLSSSGKGSLQGYCGLLASYQLAYLGINEWAILADGRDQYDIYKDLKYTDEGYRVKPYSAQDYTLEEALNAASRNGTRDVYNILVGFQKTNTAAGSRYGHAVVIYAILDGMVYFTESYGFSLCPYAGYAASCTIEQFAEYYSSWTKFEGIILFGQKEYLDNCTDYRTHMYVRAKNAAALYTQPCAPESGEAESRKLRGVEAGERLLVTALYENTLGQYYYQVVDSGVVCYVPAQQTAPERFNLEDITIADAAVPETLAPGSAFSVAGEITSVYSAIGAVHISVTDQDGQEILHHSLSKNSGSYDLQHDGFNSALDFSTLEEGAYTFQLSAEGLCSYVEEGQLLTKKQITTLCSVPFKVGQAQQAETADKNTLVYDGWVLESDTWHYYEKGTPRTGWFCYDGIDYYLKEDGAVTTGWAVINGKERFFSDTGAMRTGWITTDRGSMYLLSNGEAAHGWRTIDGKLYYFDANGLMQDSCWVTDQDGKYYLNNDGSAATGWVTLKEGTFCFRETDGRLLAQAVVSQGKTVLRAYDAAVGAVTSLPTPALKNAGNTL